MASREYVLRRMPVTRVVAAPAALDTLAVPPGRLIFRTAPDEALILPPVEDLDLDDPQAIVIHDGGWAGLWLPAAQAADFHARSCSWALPEGRPALAQGALAGIPSKLWLEEDRVLFLIPAPYTADFAERLQ